MKLFLASEAKNEATMPKIIDWLGAQKNEEIVYIPTAANGEGYGCWRDSTTVAQAQELGLNLKICQLEDHKITPVHEILKTAKVVWMGGGVAGYLLYWLYRTGTARILMSKIQEGTPYIGSSSGAMILGPTMDMSEYYPGDNEVGAKNFPPLSVLNFDIYPHYEEAHMETIRQYYTGPRLYLLKNGEHVTVEGDTVTIFGEERYYVPEA